MDYGQRYSLHQSQRDSHAFIRHETRCLQLLLGEGKEAWTIRYYTPTSLRHQGIRITTKQDRPLITNQHPYKLISFPSLR
ncbi:hypothetical protein YC2023_070773 [Brassica napus]